MPLPTWLKATLSQLRARLFDIYATKSYSQEGEDMILQRIFAGKESGFYVDVGAHHPRRFSNTYFFYRRGWSGINIEPNPEAVRTFQSDRERDTNLQCGISDRAGNLTYFSFDEAALNTFDQALAKSRIASTPYKLVGTETIPVERLESILSKHVPENRPIDFLSIDAEGLDFPVLQSNDWSRYRPTCVLVEALGISLEQAMQGDIYRFMKSHGYELLAKTFNTLIFCEKEAIAALNN
jgi:FkbM family methyltransferase